MNELRKTVSHSEVETYLKCERAHYYAYGMEITRNFSSEALNRGSFGHKALEVYFNAMKAKTPFIEAQSLTISFIANHMAMHPDEITACNEAMSGIQVFFAMGGMQEFEILAVEKEFVFKIDDELEMPFIPDVLARDTTGQIGVVDNKFIKSIYSDRDVELMPQIPKYIGALRAMGFDVTWGALNEIKWYKAQKDTDADRYRFERMYLPDARIQTAFKEQIVTSYRILEKKKLVAEKGEQGLYEWSQDAVRTANSLVCGSCSFRSICVAEMNQDQPQMILDNEYKKKERREFKDSSNGQ